jgi:hypothetical protein
VSTTRSDLPPQNQNRDRNAPAGQPISVVIDRVLARQLGYGSPSRPSPDGHFPGVLGPGPGRSRSSASSRTTRYRTRARHDLEHLSARARRRALSVVVRLPADVSKWRRSGRSGLRDRRNRRCAASSTTCSTELQKFRDQSSIRRAHGFAFFISIIGLFGMAVQVAGGAF